MVSCVVEFSAAKLTKYLECKHEHALPSLLAVCQRAKASSDRFARNSASWKDWKGGGGCHGVSLHRHFSDTNTPQRNPTDDSLRDSFENSPFTDLTVSTTLYNVNPSVPPTSKNLGSALLRPKVKFDKFSRSAAGPKL